VEGQCLGELGFCSSPGAFGRELRIDHQHTAAQGKRQSKAKRSKAKQSKARQARQRLDRLDRLDRLERLGRLGS